MVEIEVKVFFLKNREGLCLFAQHANQDYTFIRKRKPKHVKHVNQPITTGIIIITTTIIAITATATT